ncbi:MAG: OmpA family protein [Alcanivorax sp.]|nr:OmpA family protein [Alcanivorax sp.]
MFRFLLVGLLLVATLPALAGQGFYLGGALGWAMTDVDSATVQARMAAAGIPGDVRVDDENRPGGKVFAGYGWRYLALEGGYVHLDTPESDFQNVGAISVDDLGDVAPASGNGAELALMARYPVTDRVAVLLRGGLFHWEYSLRADTRKRFTGTDPTWGAGLEWASAGPWRARLGWDRYQVGPDDTDLVSVALVRQFGRAPVAVAQHEQAPVLEKTPAQETTTQVPAAALQPDTTPETDTGPFTLGLLTFRFGEREPETAALSEVAAYLQRHPDVPVTVRGHTDSQGPQAYNEQLALARARAVADLLVEQGVAAERLEVTGAGSQEPLADNDTPEGRAMNRRVEITLKKGGAE